MHGKELAVSVEAGIVSLFQKQKKSWPLPVNWS